MTFATRIAEIMDDRSVNPTEMAKALGVSTQAAGQWKRGDAVPRPSRYDAIAKFLGVTVPELVSEIGTPFSAANPTKEVTDIASRKPPRQSQVVEDAETLELLEIWEHVPKSRRRMGLKILANLRDDEFPNLG